MATATTTTKPFFFARANTKGGFFILVLIGNCLPYDLKLVKYYPEKPTLDPFKCSFPMFPFCNLEHNPLSARWLKYGA
jgi:hypothetical protein